MRYSKKSYDDFYTKRGNMEMIKMMRVMMLMIKMMMRVMMSMIKMRTRVMMLMIEIRTLKQ